MKALLFERNVGRYVASRVASTLGGSGRGVKVGPLRLADIDAPTLPSTGWRNLDVVLSGICGSDLATLDGHSSRYFEDIVSFPFVPGHEICARLADGEGAGNRVVVEPVLTCAARAISPVCNGCASGNTGLCTSLGHGHISPGLQTGYCSDTAGGWGSGLIAHESQIHMVPENFSDEAAVMVEPTACGIHAALAAGAGSNDVVAVIGAGTLGLTTIAAIARYCPPRVLISGAKHPVQREFAAQFGADIVAEPGELRRAIRRVTGSLSTGAYLSSGADVVVDCVGSSDSIADALTMVTPRGRIVLVGMPGSVKVDLAPLWHREISLSGAYAYGCEEIAIPKNTSTTAPASRKAASASPKASRATASRTFDLAFELVASAGLEKLVSATYPLERYEEAVAHAAQAGPRGSVKIAFDLRARSQRDGIIAHPQHGNQDRK